MADLVTSVELNELSNLEEFAIHFSGLEVGNRFSMP